MFFWHGMITMAALDINVPWTIPVATQSITVTPGTDVSFSWTGYHNVYEVFSNADFETCNVNNGVQRAGTTANQYTQRMHAGTHYFICAIGSHCAYGQKVRVHVQEPPCTRSLPESTHVCANLFTADLGLGETCTLFRQNDGTCCEATADGSACAPEHIIIFFEFLMIYPTEDRVGTECSSVYMHFKLCYAALRPVRES